MMYVVTVDFVAKASHEEPFRPAMIENATASRAPAPACRHVHGA